MNSGCWTHSIRNNSNRNYHRLRYGGKQFHSLLSFVLHLSIFMQVYDIQYRQSIQVRRRNENSLLLNNKSWTISKFRILDECLLFEIDERSIYICAFFARFGHVSNAFMANCEYILQLFDFLEWFFSFWFFLLTLDCCGALNIDLR